MTSTAEGQGALLEAALQAVRRARVRIGELEAASHEPIAVVGIGCRLPGRAGSPEEFWRLLSTGTDAVTPFPASRRVPDDLDGAASPQYGAFIDDVDAFDARFFGIVPAEAARMDPQQRLFLEVAWEALEDAGQTRDGLKGSPVGVFVGANSSEYFHMQLAAADQVNMHTLMGGTGSAIANRLSYVLDLRGPSLVVDSACSSSLVAVHMACGSLRRRETSLAVVGGVQLLLSPAVARAYASDQLLAPDGRCKTFDASADGFTRGEGVGVIVCKRLSDAVAAGDRVWALIRGTAVNQDGRTNGLVAPSGLAQKEVIEQALREARLSASQITMVETHGTATVVGDPIEVEALAECYGRGDAPDDLCVLGSVKTNIGHLEPAAGIVGLIKAALSIHHGVIPASLHFNQLNPHISLTGTRLAVSSRTRPWNLPESRRHAAVSAFGAGGTNAHAILGPASAAPQPSAVPAGPYVLPISAASADGLAAMAGAYRDFLRSPIGAATPFADIVHTAVRRRTQHDHRLTVVAESAAEAGDKIERWLAGEAAGRVGRKLVFLFPGQGAQRPAMGRELMRTCPVFRDAVMACDEALHPHLGRSVVADIGAMPQDAELTRTCLVQPALFALSVGLAARLKAFGVEPDVVVGHSMGEVAAAYVAGALSLADAALVISTRSRLLERLSGRGAMVAVGLPADEVAAVLGSSRIDDVSVAAMNGPVATIVAGSPAGVREVVSLFKARNVFCRPLAADGASHCALVDEVLDEMADALAGLRPRQVRVPFLSTVTGQPCDGTELGAAYWAENVRRPVRFWDTLRTLVAQDCGVFLELGPHPTLLPAVQQAFDAAGVEGLALPALRRDEPEQHAVFDVLGALHTNGFPVALPDPAGGRVTSLPTYAWRHERFWFHTPDRDPSTPLSQVARQMSTQDSAVPEDVHTAVLDAVAAVLGFAATEIDPGEGFFALGMDSAMAVRVTAILAKVLGHKVSVALIFEHPTVSALADALSGAPATRTSPDSDGLDRLDENTLLELLRKELSTTPPSSRGEA